MDNEIRRNMALFPIGIVMKLTDLTARQIRYYEQHELIKPARTSGNQRLFSLNDVERLLEIRSLIEKGVNLAGIKEMLSPVSKTTEPSEISPEWEEKRKEMSEKEMKDLLKNQIKASILKPGNVSIIQGQLSRFLQ